MGFTSKQKLKKNNLRKKKKTEYTLKKSVGAGFDLFQNYRVKAKKKRILEKELLSENASNDKKENAVNPFVAVLRQRKMSLTKISKTPRRKKSSKKPANNIHKISENANDNQSKSKIDNKSKTKKETKRKKKKHQRNDTKHGSLDLMEITRDIGHLDIGKTKNKKEKKVKKTQKKKIDSTASLKKRSSQKNKSKKYDDSVNVDQIIESIQTEQVAKETKIKKNGISKLKIRRSRSNEFESKLSPKKSGKLSPKVSPRQFPKKRNKKVKKMENLKLSADDLPKRSKSSIHLQTKKKIKKKTNVSPKKGNKKRTNSINTELSKPNVVSVENWLQNIGLSQYAELFIENGLDDTMFVKNIKNDGILKEIGMKKIGHRHHIIAEIEKLNALDVVIKSEEQKNEESEERMKSKKVIRTKKKLNIEASYD